MIKIHRNLLVFLHQSIMKRQNCSKSVAFLMERISKKEIPQKRMFIQFS